MGSNDRIKIGDWADQWQDGIAKTITFCVTEACNMACKYCYMTGKNTKNKMDFETAKKAVDYILTQEDLFEVGSVIWDFIGGEPFVEVELLDQISDYIKYKMFMLDHPWFNSYRFNITTNGLLYADPKVQKYIQKNRTHLSITITVDGNKLKHDQQRVKLDGSGTYDDVLKNVPLWLKQFPHASTKATFAHDDLPYLKDSIISIWENGIKKIASNVVFENDWKEGDDEIFESQIRELGDYVLEKGLWNDYTVRFLDPKIGFPLSAEDRKRNFCGAGRMLAVDYKGKFYPCIRFLDFTLNKKEAICVGDIHNGINPDYVRPFLALTLESQSNEECLNCEVASGCSWCTGHNYDESEDGTIYNRATYICKMHKANVRAVEYFWDKFSKVTGQASLREQYRQQKNKGNRNEPEVKYLQFITSDNMTPHCSYRNKRGSSERMDEALIQRGLEFAEKNGFVPVILGDTAVEAQGSFSIVDSKSETAGRSPVVVFDNCADALQGFRGTAILLIAGDNLSRLAELAAALYPNRVNIILEDIEKWTDKELKLYGEQLDIISDSIMAAYIKGRKITVNVLSDILNLENMCNCEAGKETFALAPNGKLYLCPAFYFENPEDSIGDLEKGISIKNERLLDIKNAPLCSGCDANHCRRCKYQNKKLTREINTPSGIQCRISHLERSKSRELQQRLLEKGFKYGKNMISEIDYADPIEKFIKLK